MNKPVKTLFVLCVLILAVVFGFFLGRTMMFDYTLVESNSIGDSMFPTLSEDIDRIILFDKKPQIGDIISFDCIARGRCGEHYDLEENIFITHRLISIKPDGCMEIRGDNVATRDPNEPCYYPDKDIKIRGVVYGLIK